MSETHRPSERNYYSQPSTLLCFDSSGMLRSSDGEDLRNDDSLQLVGTIDQIGHNVGLLDDVFPELRLSSPNYPAAALGDQNQATGS